MKTARRHRKPVDFLNVANLLVEISRDFYHAVGRWERAATSAR
jgi:hypothetical protein